MASKSNRPFFHVVDVETGGLSFKHRNTPLLQIYGTNLKPYSQAGPWDPRTFVKPGKSYTDPSGQEVRFTYQYSQTTKEGQDIYQYATKSVQSEEEAVGTFFRAAEESLATNRRFLFAAWNPTHDTGVLSQAASRYESTAKYADFFSRPGVKTFALEKPFQEFALMYGQADPTFASRYLRMGPSSPVTATSGPGVVASTVEQMKYVPGWKVETIVNSLGGKERFLANPRFASFHEAVTDVEIEQQLFERFREAKQLVSHRGVSFTDAMRTAQLLPKGETAETFFSKVFSNPWASQLAKQAEQGVALKPIRSTSYAKYATPVLIGAAAALVAYQLANSKRKDRQTQITGLSDVGIAANLRHALTDFGSGYQGQDNTSYRKTLEFLAIGGAAYGAHQWALKAGFAESIYQFAKKAEERSPGSILRTFGLSQWASSYRPEEVFLRPEQLFAGRDLTETGKHIERLLNISPLEERFKLGMRFKRVSANDPYLALEGAEGYAVRFAERGRLTASSARYGRALQELPDPRITADTLPGQARQWLKFRQDRQTLRNPLRKKEAFKFQMGGEDTFFHPIYGKRPGFQRIASEMETVERLGFEAGERPLQSLFRKVGLGLDFGSYNKLFKIPGVGEGKGILNELLLKRVLPIYAGVTALRYLNYQFDNKPAKTIAGIPLKANIARAELTDKIPGLRAVTDKYEEIVPGPQYGPLALPIGAGVLGVVAEHYLPILRGTKEFTTYAARNASALKAGLKWGKWGALAMLPFIPGMIGSRKTADELRRIYSGEEEVPIKSGRWWDVGSTPWEGGRVKYYRPHWYALMQSKAETVATYGSEDAYWEHHPLLHPFKYISDPYWLERSQYYSRPYPITSPAFSNVPLVGPLLAATVGRIVKPAMRMHEADWDINNYTLYSQRLEPDMALGGIANPTPREEFSLKDVTQREAISFAEYTGLPGFIATTVYGKYGPQTTPGTDVILQGSRQMTNWSKAYYQREIGAGLFSTGDWPEGYTEQLRRFIQPEKLQVQANEIPNEMPRWLPGADYMIDFRTGDPYTKIQEGAARLPGPGYAALHPELEGISPAQYPTLTKYKILADVAPYSKEYMIYRKRVKDMAQNDTQTAIQFAKIEEQVRMMKESALHTTERRFTAPTESISGTIKSASTAGIELEQYPGQKFTFSSLGLSAADLSAAALGEQNNLSKSQVADEVDRRAMSRQEYLTGLIGREATLVVPKGAEEHALESQAVVFLGDLNVNKEMIDKGMARMRKDLGGAESRAMYSSAEQALGRYAETVSFTGEGGPLRFFPTPYHTKFWNEKTALSLYQEQEVYGNRMRRWQRPFHDMIAPWARGMYRRMTDGVMIPEDVQYKRALDSVTDELDYLRGMIQAAAHPGQSGRYTTQTKRTNIGANAFGSPQFLSTTLPRREKLYFPAFLKETDPEKRQQILQSVSPELARVLTAQWVKADVMIAREQGKEVPAVSEDGVLYTKEGLKEYEQAKTDLSYGDYVRSKQIAQTFSALGFNLPGPGSALWREGIDYEDVKLKIIQNEGYDYHDFNIYDDRAAVLWRKPYIDGAVRELTNGGNGGGSTERVRQTVERIILEGSDKYPSVTSSGQASRVGGSSINIEVDEQGDKAVMDDIRRNPEEYQ